MILLSSNNLDGILPQWNGTDGALAMLTVLDLSGNLISTRSEHIMPEWANALPSLKTLSLYENRQLTGSLSREWGALTSLTRVTMYNCPGVGGTLPPELGNLSRLETLILNNNNHVGPLPRQWAKMSSLQELNLDGNKIDGPLPSQWAALNASLAWLYLDNNQLSGVLPPNYSALTVLQRLYLDHNRLSGSLPPEWANMSSIQKTYLESNKISGSVPPEWGARKTQTNLDLNSNRISGTLPNAMGFLPDWKGLDIHGNKISGTLPSQWGSLTSLFWAEFHNNRLSGSLPPEWGGLSSLNFLFVQGNRLQGSLPTEWGKLSKLKTLNVGANRLSGTLPPTWAPLLSSLNILHLNSNRFRGTLPPSWWPNISATTTSTTTSQLKVFDARDNLLTGSIPTTLTNGPSICILLLSNNLFTGGISELSENFFRHFCEVTTFDFVTPFRPALMIQDNRLSCPLPGSPPQASQNDSNGDALASCLAYFAPIPAYEGWRKQCHYLFNKTDASGTALGNPAMVISGNFFDGPVPDWGILHDPMWHAAPFLLFDRAHWTNWLLPGFALTVYYLVGGAILLLVSSCLLFRQRDNDHSREVGSHQDSSDASNFNVGRVHTWALRCLGVLAVILLGVHLPAYVAGANFFTCGNPLLRTTAAYLADNQASSLATAIAGTLAAVPGILLVVRLYRTATEEPGPDLDAEIASSSGGVRGSGTGSGETDSTSLPSPELAPQLDDTRRVAADWNSPGKVGDNGGAHDGFKESRAIPVRAAWALTWLGAALVLSTPTALYAAAAIVPVEGPWQRAAVRVIFYGGPIYLTLINTLAVPWLARISGSRSGLPSSWLLLVSRLLSTWVVPAAVVAILDNSCGANWVKLWGACGSTETIQLMDVHGPDGGVTTSDGRYMTNTTLVDARTEICLEPAASGDAARPARNLQQCARAIVSALAPLLLEKMAIAALALPAISVINWCLFPRGVWSRLCRTRKPSPLSSVTVDFANNANAQVMTRRDVMAQIMTWLDVAIVFGPQVPLLVPLTLMAVAGQRWSMRIARERLGRRLAPGSAGVPAVWSVAVSLLVQQVLNVWLFREMTFGGGGGGGEGGGDSTAAVMDRVFVWLGVGITVLGAAWAWSHRHRHGGSLRTWIASPHGLLGRRRRHRRGDSTVELRVGDEESNRALRASLLGPRRDGDSHHHNDDGDIFE